MTDLWFRNPSSVMSVCVEEGVSRITYTRQQLARLKIDPIMYTRQFYMSTNIRPKIMVIGIQGASEYTVMDKYDSPRAVYPVWSGKGDDISVLYDFIENPWGASEDLCEDQTITKGLRPIFGQRHRVVIHNMPNPHYGVSKDLFRLISNIQQFHPDVELFINGANSFSVLFGLGFKAGDFGLADLGDKNNYIYLPNGISFPRHEIKNLVLWEDWIKTMGFSIEDVVKSGWDGSSNRTRLRIRSSKWGSAHWQSNYRFFKNSKNIAVDIDSSDADYEPPQTRSIILRRNKFTLREADNLLCDRCRIAPGCKAFRVGSICGLKESKVGDLEKFFQSRDAGRIIDGLASIAQLQARRLENSMEKETEDNDIDPDVTRQMNSLFTNGVRLAQLVNPDLKGGPKVQVNVGVNGSANVQTVTNSNPKELMSGIVYALEQQGIPRENITPAMVEGVLKGMGLGQPQQSAIEATALHEEEKASTFAASLKDPEAEKVKLIEGYLVGEKSSSARDAE